MTEFIIKTERLGLRGFRDSDIVPFASINSDPQVMEFFPATWDRERTEFAIQVINQKIADHGFAFWAAEHLESGDLAGMIGISRVGFDADFVPAVEIGWRLARKYWGVGLATEGARACLEFGFENVGLSEIVSFTSLLNKRSERVMQKIGMKRSGEFDHPKLEQGHRLTRHVLYRLTANDWRRTDETS